MTSIVVSVIVVKPWGVSVGMITTVACRTSPAFSANRHLHLAGEDMNDLLTVMQVHWATFADAELTGCEQDLAQTFISARDGVEADCRSLVAGEVCHRLDATT